MLHTRDAIRCRKLRLHDISIAHMSIHKPTGKQCVDACVTSGMAASCCSHRTSTSTRNRIRPYSLKIALSALTLDAYRLPGVFQTSADAAGEPAGNIGTCCAWT